MKMSIQIVFLKHPHFLNPEVYFHSVPLMMINIGLQLLLASVWATARAMLVHKVHPLPLDSSKPALTRHQHHPRVLFKNNDVWALLKASKSESLSWASGLEFLTHPSQDCSADKVKIAALNSLWRGKGWFSFYLRNLCPVNNFSPFLPSETKRVW